MNQGLLEQLEEKGDVLLAAGVFGLLGVMLVPLPPLLLDLLLAGSISLALLLFLAALYARKPVEFSVFPILLLVATVFRLALNVASTRLILLNGHEGSSAAGRIIETFGQFVVGGNYIVGFVVFAILVIINFVVITKGAGRVAEVAARFTLDAMPGKQMAVDGELNAGLIDENTARERRSEITREADFYGSMDGASKFIRGDAIAGIVITVINCVGGAFIGVFQQNMGLVDALQTYTILTIGDGLVGQVPALIVSTAAGLLVTRVTDQEDRALHSQVGGQLFANPRTLTMAAASLAVFALLPGLSLPFGLAAVAMGWLAWQVSKQERPSEDADSGEVTETEATPEDLLPVEPLAIEVAVDLLYLVDKRRGGELVDRIQRIRKQFAQDLGVVLPPVHLRDDLQLRTGEYVLLLRGEEIGRGVLRARQHLALDPGTATGELRGLPTTDPCFGLPAYWIPDDQVLKAQAFGFTVVDVPTVLTTHLVELMHEHAYELYDVSQLERTLERLSETHSRLIDDLVPDVLSRQVVLKVFRNLVKEGLSTRDAQTIFEALADYAPKTRDPDVLTEFVRQRLARHITRRFADEEGIVHTVQLAPRVENAVLQGLQTGDGSPNLVLDPTIARSLLIRIKQTVEAYPGPGEAVVLAPPLARGALRRLVEKVLPRVTVVSSAELLATARLEPVGTIDL